MCLPEDVEVVLDNNSGILVATVYVPFGCVEFRAHALYRSVRIQELRFAEPCSLRTIYARAFSGSALRTFVAPAQLLEVGPNAFRRCRQLTRVTLNEGL